MYNAEYFKKVAITVSGALIAIPGFATGYYVLYLIVTAIGNN
jgi:UPF0716 family protein affecting phage T7 exclusion